jgi:hypothetical protein
MNFFANQAKDQLINFAKSQLIIKLEEKLKQGDANIDALFNDLKTQLENFTVLDKNVLQTILGAICINPELAEKVKIELTTKISNIIFSEELANMSQISEDIKLKIIALSETLKDNLKNLINALIHCNATPTTSSEQPPVIGGKRNKNTKRKHRKKTKKHYKKSRGRK